MTSQQALRRVQELGDFLRTRRGRISPEQAGLPSGGRRRTPGLRREEVAQLAGVSVDWYTWLEQGRAISVSTQVLESLAQTLHLNPNEREHLFFLAHQQPPPEGPARREAVSPTLQHFLDHQQLSPALAIDSRWDIVAWNEIARLTLYDFSNLPARERNVVWRIFTSLPHRQLIVDWEHHARRLLAQFRGSYGRYPDDPWMTAIINDLLRLSPEFRAWWPDHEVLRGPEGTKMLNHPHAGLLVFKHLMFQVYDDPDLKVVVYTPTDEANTPTKLRQLLNAEHMAHAR